MTRSLLATIPVVLLATTVRADEKRIALKDAPAAVQQAIAAHSQGGTLRGVSTEISGGKRVYEAELVVGGRTKDVTFDAAGAVVSTEDEIPIDQVPAPVRAALVKGRRRWHREARRGRHRTRRDVLRSGDRDRRTQVRGHARRRRQAAEVGGDAAARRVRYSPGSGEC